VAVFDQEGIRQGINGGQSTSGISRAITNSYVENDIREINNDLRLFDSGHIIPRSLGESDFFEGWWVGQISVNFSKPRASNIKFTNNFQFQGNKGIQVFDYILALKKF
jgi:hypothetical protein